MQGKQKPRGYTPVADLLPVGFPTTTVLDGLPPVRAPPQDIPGIRAAGCPKTTRPPQRPSRSGPALYCRLHKESAALTTGPVHHRAGQASVSSEDTASHLEPNVYKEILRY